MDIVKLQISNIYQKLRKFSEDSSQDDSVIKEYINKICEPNFKLFEHIIEYILSPSVSLDYKPNLFYILKICLKVLPSSANDLQNTKDIIQAITYFISNSDKENINKDIFYTMAKVYNYSSFKPFLSENFMKGLFNSLSIFEDAELFKQILDIIMDINANTNTSEENYFIKVFHYHENSRLIPEMVPKFMNGETQKEKIINYLFTISTLIDSEKKCIFYVSDLCGLLDVLHTYLNEVSEEDIRIFLFECLDKICKFEEYYTEANKYKIGEISEIMEQVIDTSDNEYVLKFAQSIMESFKSHQ